MLHFSREYELIEPAKRRKFHSVACYFSHSKEPSDVNLDYPPAVLIKGNPVEIFFERGQLAASFESAYWPRSRAVGIPEPRVVNKSLLPREEVLVHLQIEALKHFRNQLGSGL